MFNGLVAVWCIAWLSPLAGPVNAAGSATQPFGDAKISGPAGDSEIVITTTAAMAGAIESLTWGGKEFIDHADHGRELQSALGMDCGVRPFNSETFNPTEAGSRDDGSSPTSTSRLLVQQGKGQTLISRTQMAFWLKPEEKSGGQIAQNRTVLSDYVLDKHVHIGHGSLPHIIEYEVTFEFPTGEHHPLAQIEALTGYMPPDFSHFYCFNEPTGRLEPIDHGPGEQAKPLVFATAGGSHAMGVYSPEHPSPSYGRFHFEREQVEKWNCVFRLRNPDGVAAEKHDFHLFVVVGTQEDVRKAMVELAKEYAAR
jgi:hypothetical protein